MRRETRQPRPNFKSKIEHLGLTFHTLEGKPYWNEEAAYCFTAREIETIEVATNELHEMCLVAVQHVIETKSYDRLSLPEATHEVISKAWDDDPPAIYGRFDLSFNGSEPPKLLEYNADTPTSLLEAAVVQWHWLQDVLPQADQFNSIWEGLVEKWQALQEEGYLSSGCVHFACVNAMEDLMTTAVMMDTAKEAGLDVILLPMSEIAWDSQGHRFVDQFRNPIKTLFKLYPWEFLVNDAFGSRALDTYGQIHWIEPIWKMILSNKAILPILWELFPDHPNLLPAYTDGPRDLVDYVKKPILGREGANVTIVQAGVKEATGGPYHEQGFIYQAYDPLPNFDGNIAVVGSWIINGTARGIGVRESDSAITEDDARFVPHYFV